MNRVYCLYRVSDRGQVEKNDIPMQKFLAARLLRNVDGRSSRSSLRRVYPVTS